MWGASTSWMTTSMCTPAVHILAQLVSEMYRPAWIYTPAVHVVAHTLGSAGLGYVASRVGVRGISTIRPTVH